MMTRKDYVEIAQILNESRRSLGVYDASEVEEINGAIDDISFEIASYCAEDNDRFDRVKFLKACGVVEPND